MYWFSVSSGVGVSLSDSLPTICRGWKWNQSRIFGVDSSSWLGSNSCILLKLLEVKLFIVSHLDALTSGD